MKKALIIIFTFIICSALQAQTIAGEQLAQKLADRMRDTLALTAGQREQLFAINLRLHEQKLEVRHQNGNNPSILAKSVQQVENTRDSLYKPILTEEQFFLYKEKKRNLINNQ